MKGNIDIIVIHDDVKRHSYLITELKEQYENVKLIEDADDGIEYISRNFSHKTIVVLDMDFGNGTNGFDVLKAIRQYSFLIEVIILSANEPSDARSNLTTNIPELPGLRIFDYVIRGNPNWQERVIELVNKAEVKINGSIMNSIEDWIIESPEDKDKNVYFSTEGEAYSLNDILFEVRNETEIGMDFEQKLNSLTIDLLLRGKEKL